MSSSFHGNSLRAQLYTTRDEITCFKKSRRFSELFLAKTCSIVVLGLTSSFISATSRETLNNIDSRENAKLQMRFKERHQRISPDAILIPIHRVGIKKRDAKRELSITAMGGRGCSP